MAKRKQTIKYIFYDILSSFVAWLVFWVYITATSCKDIPMLFLNGQFLIILFAVILFWECLYTMQGTYQNVYRKSRFKEFSATFIGIFCGVIVLSVFFSLFTNILPVKLTFPNIAIFFCVQFLPSCLLRLLTTTQIVKKVHAGKIGFNTLLVGSKEKAKETYHNILNQKDSSGNKFIGYVSLNEKENEDLDEFIPYLGNVIDIRRLVVSYQVEEVIIAIERAEHDKLYRIITLLEEANPIIKVTPDTKDILMGLVKMTGIFQTPLILVSREVLQPWQKSVKRLMDISFSIFAMIILFPVYLFTAIGVKLSSKGPILYHQERIGRKGKPFQIYKFRSMYVDAETDGPKLSSKTDTRITKFGRFMRKVRLDETPQFYNVLIGNMSLVGPRPERQFYIDQIMERCPEYKIIQMVKPGITSWGQVKFGYAENLDEMVERLQYDLLYVENASIATDIKILLYTFIIIVQGRGK